MGTLLANAVKIADKVTKGLKMQGTITVYPYTGDGGVGAPTESSFTIQSVITQKRRQVRNQEGTLVDSTASLTITNGTTTIGENDRVTLPGDDNKRRPVVATSSPIDAGGKLITEVYLG